jgi:hypothetical protein
MVKTVTVLLFILSSLLYCQVKISGKVTDSAGNPLPGANVFLKDTYDGISSDADGNFSFSTEEKGRAVLVISFVGYTQFEQNIVIDRENINIDVILNEESPELGTVVISAGAFEASDESKAVILRPLDIVSTGSDADIYSTLETLPGTQQIGETEGLFVRGGGASETKTIIDEMVVQNPFYTSVPDVPSRSRFSPFLFKGTVFSTGGYSAQYGQALSSTLILKTEDMPEESRTSINLLPLGLGGSHIQRWENTSLAVEGFYSNLDPYFKMIPQRVDWETAPRGFDFSANMRQKVSSSGIIKLYSSATIGDFSLYSPDLDDIPNKDFLKMNSDNYYLNANYRDIFGGDWSFFAGLSYSYDIDKINISPDNIRDIDRMGQAKVTVTKSISGSSFLTFGAETQNTIFETRFNDFKTDVNEMLTAAYAEADIFFTNDLAARIGVRGEYSKVLDKSNLAPRISLAYRVGKYEQLNFAYGEFYQTPIKEFLLQSTDFDFEKATHYIFNFQHIADDYTFRAEIYYKDYKHLAKGTLYDSYNFLDLGDIPFSNLGKGYAKGLDIFFRDRETFENTDYWISYTYLDTKRDYLNYPKQALPTFATPHTFSLVAKHWFSSITTYAGITYTFATGRPYYNPANTNFLDDRTKSYNNLSLNFSHLTSIFGNFTVVFFSIDNIPGFANVFGYRYSSDGKIKVPVLPTSMRSGILGVFISLGQSNPY